MPKTVWAYMVAKFTRIAEQHFSLNEDPRFLDFWIEFEKATEGPVTEDMAYSLRDLMDRFEIETRNKWVMFD